MFLFFKMVAADVLDFYITEILLADHVQRAERHSRAKFRQNWLIRCRDITIFRFRKIAAGAILDFLNSQFLLACEIWSIELHQFAKYHQNW